MTTFGFIDQVTGWWDSLNLARQVFYGIGILAGFVALLLAALSFIGMEHHDGVDSIDLDTDHGGGGGIFSVKPLTGFFLGFGWAGGLALDAGLSLFAALGCALLAGGSIMAVVVALFRAIYAMRSDGTMRVQDTLGAVGTVYITLPPAKAAGGQVTVNFRGRQETLPALNASDKAVPSGEKVKVIQIVDSRTLLVEPLA